MGQVMAQHLLMLPVLNQYIDDILLTQRRQTFE